MSNLRLKVKLKSGGYTLISNRVNSALVFDSLEPENNYNTGYIQADQRQEINREISEMMSIQKELGFESLEDAVNWAVEQLDLTAEIIHDNPELKIEEK